MSNSEHGQVDYTVRSTLTLMLPDSTQRADARRPRAFGAKRVDLQLVGRDSVAPSVRPNPVELDGDLLWVGCRDCTDIYATELRIDGVTKDGFVGTWLERDGGFAVVMDSDGKTSRVGGTRGHFCATRLP